MPLKIRTEPIDPKELPNADDEKWKLERKGKEICQHPTAKAGGLQVTNEVPACSGRQVKEAKVAA